MYYFIVSGKKKSKLGENIEIRLKESLDRRKVPYKIVVSEYAGHSIKLSEEYSNKKDCTAIVSVGGDGTLYEVLNGMNLNVPLGIIPAGTANDFARCLGISKNLEEALDNIIGQAPAYIDYMDANGHRAFNCVGTGFDILLLTKEKELRATGKYKDSTSYYVALAQTLLKCKFEKIKYKIDDSEEFEEDFFMIDCCNGNWGAGMMPIAIEAEPHDGFMDFNIIKKFPKIELPILLSKFQKGKLEGTKYYSHRRCKKVEIDIEPRLKANLDGEILDLFPATVQLVHKKLRYFPSLVGAKDPRYMLKHKKQYI